MKYVITLLLLLTIGGCSAILESAQPLPDLSDGTAEIIDDSLEKEETIMENQDAVQRLVDICGCSERTAQSLCTTLERAISDQISQVEDVPNEFYRILKVTSNSGDVFFAKMMKGYFISRVYADSMDGKVVYTAIR